MSKNIVIFSDGTGKEGGNGSPTNVYKLFNMIEDRTSKQIAFYDRGLGTGWRKVTGNVGGMGISKNILECYNFIFENFEANDKIYLFGFSRGATTVRSLSSFIHHFGILPKSRPELIKRAYKIYKAYNIKRIKEWEEKAKDFVEKHHNMWCRINFLGVWDTVSALGLPFKPLDVIINRIPFFRHKFHNLFLSESVENAYHAISIDDERLTFHPKLWEGKIKDYQTIKQVWFCGMHTDVGGGYKEQELSDIPLVWMVQKAVKHGLRIYPKHEVRTNQDIEGKMHDSREGFPKFLYRKKKRSWNTKTHGRSVIHESVKARKLNKKNTKEPPYSSWILNGKHEIEPWIKEVPTGKPGGWIKSFNKIQH